LTFSHLRYGPAMTPDYTPSLLRSFERHLQAENRSDNTIESYLESIRQAEAFLAGRSRTLLDARRADLEAFLGDLLQRRAPATAATRYKVLRILYTWLEEEEEITVSPMAKMRPPIVPEQPIPIVPEDGLRRLLAACAGKHFEGRRDTAIVMFLLDTGARRAELRRLGTNQQVRRCARLRERPTRSLEHRMTVRALRSTAQRIQLLAAEAADSAPSWSGWWSPSRRGC
jgi:site-specific recombinase XerD